MSDLVIRIPATIRLDEVLAGDPNLLSRIDDWEQVAVRLDDWTYIAFRTDWIPPKAALQESDGARVLLGGRWPAEVQAAFDARQFARTGPALLDKLWKRLCDETKCEAPEVAPECVAEVVEQVRDILVAHPPDGFVLRPSGHTKPSGRCRQLPNSARHTSRYAARRANAIPAARPSAGVRLE